ncbi:MAG: molecular chaperone Tir [bacterium]
MSNRCFLSFKKEDMDYKDKIVELLGGEKIKVKSLDVEIDSEDIDYVLQKIREEYMSNTSVTIFLIGKNSSENEGSDCKGNKQSFIIRELQATLYDGKGNRRSGLLGIVLPKMYSNIYGDSYECQVCGKKINYVNINDDTVIREFHKNYYLKKNKCDHYSEGDRFCVLVKYDDFINNPDKYITEAYEKTTQPISKLVQWRKLR